MQSAGYREQFTGHLLGEGSSGWEKESSVVRRGDDGELGSEGRLQQEVGSRIAAASLSWANEVTKTMLGRPADGDRLPLEGTANRNGSRPNPLTTPNQIQREELTSAEVV